MTNTTATSEPMSSMFSATKLSSPEKDQEAPGAARGAPAGTAVTAVEAAGE